MSTVTYIPATNGFFLTSNRDVGFDRDQALAPLVYYNGKRELLFPKDPYDGGSWIAAKSNGDVAALLNGAFVKHAILPWYKKSQGLVLLDIISADRPARYYQGLNLDGIEPFTLIMHTSGKLYECRWDGENKWVSTINSRVAHFWSSATLYDKMAAGKRKNWFELWRQFGAQITIRFIMDFHRYGGYGDPKDSLVMDREGTVKTVSITNIHVQPQQMTMTYHDLMGDRQHTSELQVTRGKGEFNPK